MTALDILLILGIILFMVLGFAQGVVKVLFIIVATILGLMLGSTIYQPTADWLAPQILGKNKLATLPFSLTIFFVIVFIITVLLTLFLFTSFKYAALPNSLLAIDKVGGMVLGLVLGVLALSIIVLFLKVGSDLTAGTDASSIPVVGFLVRDVSSSQVAKVLLSTQSLIQAVISPIVDTRQNLLFFTTGK